jgi:two-component system, OmpR family, response regulator
MSATVILVVEDDSAVQRTLRMAFQAAGFTAKVVDTGREALHLLEQEEPDGVTLDLGLPDGRAGEVLNWLREHAIPWLVISALDERDAAKAHGPFKGHFVAKPFDPWDVVERFERRSISALGVDEATQRSEAVLGK